MTDASDQTPADEAESTSELLPVVYAELRRLAAALTARRGPGQTLTPTALVHEAYLRLVRGQAAGEGTGWQGQRHFFGAAARAMREILIEQARRKGRLKRGGGGRRVELSEGLAWIEPPAADVLALDEAVRRLQKEDARLGEIVMLRYYTGLSVEETARVVGVSVSTLTRDWRYARAWLAGVLGEAGAPGGREAADE
jgi:RNA polymerase sigma factor (TIGR02999 family)